MAILPEAGAVTVAANFRLMYDKRSELATNNAFITGLRSAERRALEIAKDADSELLKQHEILVTKLKARTERANQELVNNATQTQKMLVASRQQAVGSRLSAEKSAYKGKGISEMVGMTKRSLFKKDLAAIEGHMRGFHQRMISMGAMGGKASFDEEFINAGYKERINILKELKTTIDSMNLETEDDVRHQKELKLLYDDMTSAHNMRAAAAARAGDIINDSNNQERQSLRNVNIETRKNRQHRMDAINAIRQHTMATQSLTMAIDMGLRNAVMQSGIALMTLGFRLNTVIESFKDFEKELMNAQSIFQTTHEILYGLSDQVALFSTRYGIEVNKAAEGLYTLASAGLSAADAQMVLNNTLKLSMAVQGDHETIAKLTTQTIFGFGLEMSDSALLTDKFAHAINKSLIEYQDLASAVKFAMPFFITTGQNIDQLLGSLEILTNRALEAGIAGRGLRQALAEFAQHADDNTAAFRRLGVEITDSEGNFLLLTEIAKNFHTQMGDMANDTELLTTLLEDLNVRGATAFIHLVQNADEFQEAVDDLANSAGAASEMAEIQQMSLANTIQRVKNALMAPFLLSDEVGKANNTMNEFSATLHTMVSNFENFFLETTPEGNKVLTEMGEVLRDFVIQTLIELNNLMIQVLGAMQNMADDGKGLITIFNTFMIPLKAVVGLFSILPSGLMQTIVMMRLLNSVIPLNIILQIAETQATMTAIGVNETLQKSMMRAKMAMGLVQASMILGIMALNTYGSAAARVVPIITALAGAWYGYSLAKSLAGSKNPAALILGTVAGAVGGFALMSMMAKATQTPEMDFKPVEVPASLTTTADLGGRMMGKGISSRHFPVMVEPGETIIPKTQNMVGSGGITLNIGGDIITSDAEDFAERIADALPRALRNINDRGGL
jgi:TP901 family phage tail tape measure protein